MAEKLEDYEKCDMIFKWKCQTVFLKMASDTEFDLMIQHRIIFQYILDFLWLNFILNR